METISAQDALKLSIGSRKGESPSIENAGDARDVRAGGTFLRTIGNGFAAVPSTLRRYLGIALATTSAAFKFYRSRTMSICFAGHRLTAEAIAHATGA
jgi:hypothetical protein